MKRFSQLVADLLGNGWIDPGKSMSAEEAVEKLFHALVAHPDVGSARAAKRLLGPKFIALLPGRTAGRRKGIRSAKQRAKDAALLDIARWHMTETGDTVMATAEWLQREHGEIVRKWSTDPQSLKRRLERLGLKSLRPR